VQQRPDEERQPRIGVLHPHVGATVTPIEDLMHSGRSFGTASDLGQRERRTPDLAAAFGGAAEERAKRW